MLDLLFVYGSLLKPLAHPQGERLRREARLVAPATVRGRLYRVSWYPGLTTAADPDDRVHGELYRLNDPARALSWLDAYEGITPGPTGVAASDEYERIIMPVLTNDGQGYDAWLYRFRKAVDAAAHVPSGRWQDA